MDSHEQAPPPQSALEPLALANDDDFVVLDNAAMNLNLDEIFMPSNEVLNTADLRTSGDEVMGDSATEFSVGHAGSGEFLTDYDSAIRSADLQVQSVEVSEDGVSVPPVSQGVRDEPCADATLTPPDYVSKSNYDLSGDAHAGPADVYQSWASNEARTDSGASNENRGTGAVATFADFETKNGYEKYTFVTSSNFGESDVKGTNAIPNPADFDGTGTDAKIPYSATKKDTDPGPGAVAKPHDNRQTLTLNPVCNQPLSSVGVEDKKGNAFPTETMDSSLQTVRQTPPVDSQPLSAVRLARENQKEDGFCKETAKTEEAESHVDDSDWRELVRRNPPRDKVYTPSDFQSEYRYACCSEACCAKCQAVCWCCPVGLCFCCADFWGETCTCCGDLCACCASSLTCGGDCKKCGNCLVECLLRSCCELVCGALICGN